MKATETADVEWNNEQIMGKFISLFTALDDAVYRTKGTVQYANFS